MFNRKELKKVVLGLTPSVIGLVLCFNGLKSVEGDLDNRINEGIVYAQQRETSKEVQPDIE